MQYAKAFTDALQFMWGEGFLSPGGHEEIDDMLEGHNLAGKRVLDIGSGLGASMCTSSSGMGRLRSLVSTWKIN